MAYTLDTNGDIVINGWEEGIKDDPYAGIYDIRNCNIVSIPGEASVSMSTQQMNVPINVSNATFTVDPSTDIFTWAGTATLTVNTAIQFTNSGGALPAGLVNTDAYYIHTVLSPTTFKIAKAVQTTALDITGAGSGTNTFSVINIGIPQQIIYENNSQWYFMTDDKFRVWVYIPSTYSYWVYLNNRPTEVTEPFMGNSIVIFKGYLLWFQYANIDYLLLSSPTFMTTKTSWVRSWKGVAVTQYRDAFVSADNRMYFCNTNYVGVLYEVAGATFNPATPASYTFNANTIGIKSDDVAICLAELNGKLLIGGTRNKIYQWDKVQTNLYYNTIFISEDWVSRMITVNNTTYVFSGTKGRIYVTNGGNATPFYKMPEYLSNTPNSSIIWTDVAFNKNQLYFGIQCIDNAGTVINQFGGLWGINIDSSTPSAPRLENILSYGNYSGYVSALCRDNKYPFQYNNGNGMLIGWYNGSNGGIDKCITDPYTNGEAYVVSDPIPTGTFKTKRTFSNLEYKLAAPLVSGESVALSYRTDLNSSFTTVPITSGGGVGDVSGLCDTVTFENTQWLQIKATLTSTATTPSYCRLREIRIR